MKIMQLERKRLSAFLLLATCLKPAAATSEGALKLTAITELCKTAKAGKALGKLIDARLTTLLNWQQQYELFRRKLQVLKILHEGKSEALDVLSGFADAALNEISSEAAGLATDGGETAATAAYAAGRIDEFINVFRSTRDSTGTNNVCIITDSNAKVEDAQLADCLDTPIATPTDPTAATRLAASDFDFQTASTLSASKSCTLTKTDLSAYSGAGDKSELKDPEWGGGVLKVAHTNRGSAATLQTAKRTLPIHAAAQTKAAATVTKLKNTQYPPVTTPDDLTQLLKTKDLSTAMAAALRKRQPQPPPPSYTPKHTELQTLFGFTDSSSKINFLEALDTQKVNVKVSGTTKPIAVLELTDQTISEGEIDALSKMQQKLIAARTEKVCESTDKKTAENICNKIKDATQCNNKAFCSYNETEAETDKKCKFNSTKSSKSEVSVTQTQTAGTETTTDKCKDKKKDDCKSPDCKYEGETLKNFSFLINKKFSLSLAAAFVSLVDVKDSKEFFKFNKIYKAYYFCLFVYFNIF
uniref:Variant surface glycoprotein 805 n=1 Tax=Trypanosoma brucei TaxID=5691 RepID=M4SYR9_9TRYP|nr:variant surface glycoprotein 805 [Trypanosoma brucei]